MGILSGFRTLFLSPSPLFLGLEAEESVDRAQPPLNGAEPCKKKKPETWRRHIGSHNKSDFARSRPGGSIIQISFFSRSTRCSGDRYRDPMPGANYPVRLPFSPPALGS
ncbi:uncharacterized protein P884DRAFT_265019 [Thermothelomyces heterothallicus CBS 202.75]|uniref:uncharacterized protein n=1 Tax=Thermothelomyces heterothallicus CBS 202.75 TaxID=1149848 RepID=UPI003742EB95